MSLLYEKILDFRNTNLGLKKKKKMKYCIVLQDNWFTWHLSYFCVQFFLDSFAGFIHLPDW